MKIKLRGPLENVYTEKKPKPKINLTPRGEFYARNYNFENETTIGITPMPSFVSGVFSSTTSNSASVEYTATNPIMFMSGVITEWTIR